MGFFGYTKRKLPPADIRYGRQTSNGLYSRYSDMYYTFEEDGASLIQGFEETPENNAAPLDLEKEEQNEPVEKSGKRLSRAEMLKGKLKKGEDSRVDRKKEKKPKLFSAKNKNKYDDPSYDSEYQQDKYVKKKKGKKPSPKFATDEQLAELGYPKEYFDPTDEEFDKDGNAHYYFNIDKTMTKYGLNKLKRILPMQKLDKLTYDKESLDNFAEKQHASAEKLSSASPKEQYKHDRSISLYKKLAIGAAAFLVFFLFANVIIPNTMFSKGTKAMAEKNWADAASAFKKAGSHENGKNYEKYCSGMAALENKEYDKAKEYFNYLIEEEVSIEGVDYSTLENRITYQKALDYYNAGDFKNAKKTFFSISKFEDAADYYYKCGYKMGSDYYEEGNLEASMREFYYVKDFSDAKDRFEEIARGIYANGKEYYNKKDFEKGAIEFKKIAPFGYSDSISMQYQCSYRNAVNLISNGQYEESIPVLKELGTYKDSKAILSEAYYRIGNETFSSSPSDAIGYYGQIPYFRDTAKKLLLPQLVLYGTWEVTEMDEVAQSGIEFTFNAKCEILTKTSMQNTAISTEALSNPYSWAGKSYVCGGYMIQIKTYTYDEILIACSNEGHKTLYKCKRISSPSDALSVQMDATSTFEKGTLEYYLQQYINKKTDGIIVIGNQKIQMEDLLDGKVNLSSGQSTPDEAQ